MTLADMTEKPTPSSSTYRLPKSHRLHGRREFAAVYAARVRKSLGPISVLGRPNDLGHCRLGLSVGRKVGTAVVRNRVKRLIREAFRLCQHDWPQGYDIVVVVRPHETATLADYQRMLFSGVRWVHLHCPRRGQGPKDGLV